MKIEKMTLFVDEEEVKSEYANKIGDYILDLNLRAGDKVKIFYFNQLQDEETSFVGEKKDYHTNLRIVSITYNLIESWNRSIRKEIEIKLQKWI